MKNRLLQFESVQAIGLEALALVLAGVWNAWRRTEPVRKHLSEVASVAVPEIKRLAAELSVPGLSSLQRASRGIRHIVHRR